MVKIIPQFAITTSLQSLLFLGYFLAVQDSSIGDLVTHSLSE